MKKIIALTLAALMLICFTACGVKDAVNDAVEGAIENMAEKANEDITRGAVSGNTYTSEYSGISFTKPDTWTYSDDETLASLLNQSMDSIDMNDISKTLAESGTVYDMMVSDAETGSNLMVLYENMDVTNAGNAMSAQEYLDTLKTQLPAQSGMDYEFMIEETVILSGNEYLKGTFTLTVDTMIISQIYYLRAMDNVMCCLISTPVNGVTAEDIEAMFA